MTAIGRFEIQSEIGRGGFGRVFRAYDPKVGRNVAIKILESDGDPSKSSRFRNEATAAGNLHHKNIVTVHEFGEDQGRQFLVMEYLEGDDLQKVLRQESRNERQPLSLLERISVMSQVAEGLDYAHRCGVLHRDVKPANIMLLTDGSIKIMDFGIARLTADTSTRLTQQGFLIGTVLYMAPEQLRGSDVDALCDIWSYGVILYELLAGRNPFETGNLHSEMYKITHEDAEALPHLQCPEALQPVVRRLLARDRDLRYQSLEDVRFDLEPVLIELQKQKAQELLPNAQTLLNNGLLTEANSAVRCILELDPENREARGLRERIHVSLHQRTIRPRVEGLIRRSDEEAEQRRFAQAIDLLSSAREFAGQDESIESRLRKLQSAKERDEKAQRLVISAKEELSRNLLTSAFDRISEAYRTDPEHPEASKLLAEIQLQIQKRDEAREIEAELHRVRGMIAIEAFDQAAGLLTELNTANPGRTEIRDLMVRVAAQKEESEKRRRLEAALESGRTSIKRGEFAEAIRTLESVTQDFPGNAELADLLAYARQELSARQRTAAIDSLSAQVDGLVRSHRYEDALSAIQQCLQSYPEEIVLSRLLRSVIAGQQAHEKQRVLREGWARIRDLQARGASQEAWKLVQSLLADNPADPELLAQEIQLREETRKQERAAAIKRDIERAEALLKQERPQEAVPLIQAALRTHGDDARLVDILQRANKASEEQHKRDYVASQLAQAADLERRQDLQAAITCIRNARKRFPDQFELSEAEQRLEASLSRMARDRQVAAEKMAIESEFKAHAWDAALTRILNAQNNYPDESAFTKLYDEAELLRNQEISDLIGQARQHIAAGRLEEAERTLAGRLATHANDSAVRAIADELVRERSRRIEDGRQEQQKRKDIQERLAAIAKHESDHDWSRAQDATRKALEKYSGNAEFAAAQSRIELAIHRQQQEQKTAAEQDEIKALLAKGDWSSALPRINRVRLQPPVPPAFLALWTEAQRQKTQELAAILRQARQLLISGQADAAESLAGTHYARFSGEPDYNAFCKEIAEQKARLNEAARRDQEKRQFVARELGRASKYEGGGDLPGALEVVRNALQQLPGEAVLTRELRRLEQVCGDADRSRRLENVVREIQSEIDKKVWEAALTLIQKASAEFPGEPVFLELQALAYEKRQAELDGFLARARSYLVKGEIKQTENLLQKELQPYRNEPSVMLLSKDLADEIFCKQQEAITRKHIASRKFSDAQRAIQELAARVPGRGILEVLQAALKSAQESERKETKYRDGLAEAQRYFQAAQYEDSIRQYEALLLEFPRDAKLEKGLKAAIKARDANDRTTRLESEIARLEELRRRGSAGEVHRMALLLLNEGENQRLRELLEWADTILAAPPAATDNVTHMFSATGDLTSESAGPLIAASQRPDGSTARPVHVPRPKWQFAAAVLLAAAIAAGAIVYFTRSSAKNVARVSNNSSPGTAATTPAQEPAKPADVPPPASDNNRPALSPIAAGATGAAAPNNDVPAGATQPGDPRSKSPSPPPTPQPTLTATRDIVFPRYQVGGPQPAAQEIAIASSNPSRGLPFSVSPLGPLCSSWLVLNPTTGTTGNVSKIRASVNTAGLHPGSSYSCNVTIRAANTAATVVLSVEAIAPTQSEVRATRVPSVVQVNPTLVSFGAIQLGGSLPTPKAIRIDSSNPASGLQFTATPGSNCGWLSLSSASGVTPATLGVSVNAAGLVAKDYSCTIAFSGSAANIPPVTATLHVMEPAVPTCTAPPAGFYRESGDITLSGDIHKDEKLTLFGNNLRGPATIQRVSTPVPFGVPMEIDQEQSTPGLTYSFSTNYCQLTIQNTSDQSKSNIRIRWKARK